MLGIKKRMVVFSLMAAVATATLGTAAPAFASEIKYVVNGQAITSYDLQRRVAFLKLQRAKGNLNQQAADQMIEQALKRAEMKRMNVNITDKAVDDAYARFATNNKMTLPQLDTVMSKSGVTKSHFKDFIRAQMGWGQVVSRKAGGDGDGRVTEQEAVRRMLQQGGQKPKATEYMLQQVIFVVPAKERGKMGARRREAEAMRARFNGCNASRSLAKGLIDVTVRDLGRVLEPQLPNEWADSIKATRAGGATPVRETERGIEFIGICSAREVSDDRVAQMVFQQEANGGADAGGDDMSKKFLKELRDKAKIVQQ
ncbi:MULTISPECIES: peptidylprolyl isomerase [Mesorhizobium]|uniref:Peptidylprolyl isomerase n=1 Tax=Mesorhizobium denitrificans TaxID=2294114 RepID=A0A371XIP9_9HYPH|nr:MULTISPECIES: peptidylprolyl isomerase [Mesorhizobium]RFC69093.1 peptidylprolyl isomerase [Mesorhizobium denitrificans]